ncbi:MAG: hypothetical protein A2937_01550 [Candidatus Yonathbacteria bacterium RIFCSPLOWO2_01_FULL_47_33b]|uniref:Uncharacterized protein n=1 Tax=Candidatus Yonathbacteria bacterium RIFCSPLOWO2_01_FULL_47_33b TaxID=1802727 RepID=A0A1G2SHA6_9BACT|nr:MAG: hypothetical protein A2937_01550 [Candidatus Yonathbacteria bacterium RIFCSPLOWO2_01_FULL_47_33b]
MQYKTKFYSFRNRSRKEWGRDAVIGILGGYVITIALDAELFKALGSIISLLGFLCSVVWVIKTISPKKNSLQHTE